jgi:hypothetical protein
MHLQSPHIAFAPDAGNVGKSVDVSTLHPDVSLFSQWLFHHETNMPQCYLLTRALSRYAQ